MKPIQSRIVGWLVAVVAVGCVLLLKLYLHRHHIAEESPFIFFMGAILVTVAAGGLSAGLVATVLALFAIDRFILTPNTIWSGNTRSQNLLLAVFAVEGLFVSFLGAALRRALRAAEEKTEAVKKSKARFRRMVEGNLIPIFFRDERGQVTEANDAFLELVGYTRDDLAHGRVRTIDLTPNEYKAAERRAFEELADAVSCTPFEIEYFRKDRRRVPLLISMVRLGETTDEIACFVLDLTKFPHLRTNGALGPVMAG